MRTYKIAGDEANRLAARDGLTLGADGVVHVIPTGWRDADDCDCDDDGRTVEAYFGGSGEYLGPDDCGIEPCWADAPENVPAAVATPGPWWVAGGGCDRFAVYSAECCVAVMGDGSGPENAARIAAVPDLVEALKLLLCGAEQAQKRGFVQAQLNGGVIMARAALAKAGVAVEGL